MGIKNEMSLRFLSKSENESFARIVVASFASQLDPNLEDIADIKTAVSEAVTNAIIHGYENNKGYVNINASIKDGSLIVEVIDEGKGIEDIEKARQPLYTSKPELERSGMGFTVMETFMDSVNVYSEVGKGTRIEMVKKIQKIHVNQTSG